MSNEKYIGFDQVIHEALVSARGKRLPGSREDRILALERKLDTAILTQAEVTALQKQLKELRKQTSSPPAPPNKKAG
jgi:hypothetical protein